MVRFDEYDGLVRVCRRLLIGNVRFRDGLPWDLYFEPELRTGELAGDRPTLDEQLRREGERMRHRMIGMLDELRRS